MKEYKVRVDVETIYFTTLAESEEEAINRAKDLAYDESHYSIFDQAQFQVVEEGEDE